MSRINVCPACNADAHGVKSRIAFEHTCGKGELNKEQFETIANAIREQSAPEWQQADTGGYLLLRILFGDAQRYAMAYGVAIQTGLGKTFAAQRYANEGKNAFYVKCEEDMRLIDLLSAIARAIGAMKFPNKVVDLQDKLIKLIECYEEPLIIFDDMHLLKMHVRGYAIRFYKKMINHLGIVVLGTDDLRNSIVEGARLNKEIASEIYNCIGRRFVTLGQLGPRDVELVCKANGIAEADVIDDIKDLSKGSLHNTASLIKQYKAEGRL